MNAVRGGSSAIASAVLAMAILLASAARLDAQGQSGPIPPPPGHRVPPPPPGPGEQKIPAPAISVETALVGLDVLVTDEDGLILAGLKKENFRILDEGTPQTVTTFEPTGAPITIVMLLENSGSS